METSWLQDTNDHQQWDPNPGDGVGAQLLRHLATKSLSACVRVHTHTLGCVLQATAGC